MTFGLSMRGVGYVQSYTAAKALYDRAPVRRAGSSGAGERKLPGHLKNYTGMTLTAAGVGFVYHRTTVALWMPDNTCILDLSYGSHSTTTFANRFSPYNISVAKECAAISDGRHWYLANSVVRVRPDGEIERGTLPIVRWVLNKERTKQVRKDTNYDAFAKWYRTMAPLADRVHYRDDIRSGSGLLDALRNESKWHDIMTSAMFGLQTPKQFLPILRKFLYQNFDVYDSVPETHANSYAQLCRWVR